MDIEQLTNLKQIAAHLRCAARRLDEHIDEPDAPDERHDEPETCPICGERDVYHYEGANRGCRDCKSQWHEPDYYDDGTRTPKGTPTPDEVVEALANGDTCRKYQHRLAAAVRAL